MQDLETEVSNFVEENNLIVVNSNEDLSKATACIRSIKGIMDKVKQSFDPIIEKTHKSHKEAIGQRDKYLKPLIDIERKFKDAILVFNKKMEAEQRERERIARERMEEAAEEERQRLLREAAKSKDEWDKEELKEKAAAVVPVEIETQKKVIEQEGISIKKTWKARVLDINLVPKTWLIIEPNMSALNKHARDNRDIPIPGVEFYEESSVASR